MLIRLSIVIVFLYVTHNLVFKTRSKIGITILALQRRKRNLIGFSNLPPNYSNWQNQDHENFYSKPMVLILLHFSPYVRNSDLT